MASEAANFIAHCIDWWETYATSICPRAEKLGAVKTRALLERENELENPASLWRFRDNSYVVIQDDGHAVISPRACSINIRREVDYQPTEKVYVSK